MSVTLKATAGPASGMKIVVPRGIVAQVGRTRWADHCIAGDPSLAEIHFAIDNGSQGCLLRDLSGGKGTLLNGTKIAADAKIHSGDQIVAGANTFLVQVQGEPLPTAATVELEPEIGKNTARYYASQLDLGSDAQALLQPKQRPAEYLDLLIAKELYADALRFVAFWLPPPQSVGWGCRSVESAVGANIAGRDKAALAAARQWSEEPNEKNRRAAEAAAEMSKYSGPASFLAAAAFWSGGSLAPEGMQAVPPAEGLTSQGVSAALLMAASVGPPLELGKRYRTFLREGKKLAESLPET